MKCSKQSFLAITCCVFFSILMTGCDDEKKVAAAQQLSVDGKAAGDAMVKYFAAGRDVIRSIYDATALGVASAEFKKKKLADIDSMVEFYQKCMTYPEVIDALPRYESGIRLGKYFSDLYSALGLVAASKNVTDAQASANDAYEALSKIIEINNQQKISVALGTSVELVMKHLQAKEVDKVLAALSGIPQQYAAILSSSVGDVIDADLRNYDGKVAVALRSAYASSAADATPILDAYFTSIGAKLSDKAGTDPALIAFAIFQRQKVLTATVNQSRQQLIGLFKTVAQESDSITQIGTAGPSGKEEREDVLRLLSTVESILHPNPNNSK